MDNRFYIMQPDTTQPFPAHPEPYGNETWGIVDEEAGVIAWVGGLDRANALCDLLNRAALLSLSSSGSDYLVTLADAHSVAEAFSRIS